MLVGALADEAETLNEAFLKSVRDRRPVRPPEVGRVARRAHRDADRRLEVDHGRGRAEGRPAPARGVRRDPRRRAGTVLADDPLLTRRLALSSAITPHRRLVLDGALRVPATARVFSAAGGEVWLVTAVPAGDPRLAPFLERGVQVFSLPATGGRRRGPRGPPRGPPRARGALPPRRGRRRDGRVVPRRGPRGPGDRLRRAAARRAAPPPTRRSRATGPASARGRPPPRRPRRGPHRSRSRDSRAGSCAARVG